ncbi:hypothetical protein C2G38_2030198 [Gigaspora rosea]|uniref:Pre-rRNA processing protein n=1 Tax=Gigaspora rosea TaxID=44941 RepID=A0A397VV65_9GLOM|nr:hypothetical protein C2G38_2030198 [Gigaspora rosea]
MYDEDDDVKNIGAERLSQSQKSHDHSTPSSHSSPPSNRNRNSDIINTDYLYPNQQQQNISNKSSNNTSNTNLSNNQSSNSTERYSKIFPDLFSNSSNNSFRNSTSKRSSNIINPYQPPNQRRDPDFDDSNLNSDQYEPLNARRHKSYLSTSSSQPSPTLTEDPNNNKKEFSSFLQNRRKSLCLCCGIFALIILIMIPIFLFVVAPAIARNVVAESKISFRNVKLSNISEDNFSLTFSGAVTNTGPLSATITIPDGVSVSFKNSTLGSMPMDTINTKPFNGATLESTNLFKVVDKEALTIFSKFMLTEKEFTWHLEGNTIIKCSGLTINDVELSKDVTLSGMNNFPNVTVNNFDAPSDHPDGGIAISIISTINNPSQISVELGDIMFDLVHMDQTIGQIVSTNFTLLQGDNKLSLEGRLLPQNSSAGVTAVSDLFSKFIVGEDSFINVIAKMVKPNNSATPISWLQDAFNGTVLNVIFPGRKDLNIIHSVSIDSLDLVFNPEDQYTPMASSSLLSASFSIPFGFQLFVQQISQDIELFDGQTKLATLSIPFTNASGDSQSGNLTSSFAPTQFKVVSGSEKIFNDFAKRLTLEKNVTFTMKGIENVISNTSIGNVKIEGIKFSVQTTLQGIQGLKSSPTVINSLKVTGGSPEHINIELLVNLSNPSNVKIALNSDVTFDLICNETIIGTVIIPNLVLDRGENNLKVLALFSPNGDEERQVGRILLNNFLAGKTNNVSIKGNETSTTLEPLRQAFEAIELTTVMPGLVTDIPILNRTFFSIRFNSLFDKKGKAAIEIFNPLDTVIRFLKIDANVTVKNESIGVINQIFDENDQIVVQGGQSLISHDMELDLKISVKAIKSLVDAVNGDLKVNVTSNITISVGDDNGGFVTDIEYSQNEVPSELKNKNSNDVLPFF